MRRRTLLTSLGGVIAGLTGCLDRRDGGSASPDQPTSRADETATDASTDLDTPTATATPSAEATVESAIQHHGFLVLNDDAVEIRRPDDRYLVVEVRVDSGAYEQDAFTLSVDETTVRPTRIREFYWTDWDADQWYEPGRERGTLLFELPDELGSETPRLTWPTGEWRPDEGLARRLRTPRPSFSTSITVPNATDGTREKTVELNVTNEGDERGRYLAGLNRSGPLIAFTPVGQVNELLDPGETRTFEFDDQWSEYPDDDERDYTVEYHLSDADDSDKLEIPLS